jgi:hypothetical protein
MSDLFTPPDVMEAYKRHKATCGPAALAAVFRAPIIQVMRVFPGFKGWCNPTTMKAALVQWAGERSFFERHPDIWPTLGLAFLQITGPWEANARGAYRHTHWIGVAHSADDRRVVYDINAGTDEVPGGWANKPDWERETLPLILAAHPRATGWRVRMMLEVKR